MPPAISTSTALATASSDAAIAVSPQVKLESPAAGSHLMLQKASLPADVLPRCNSAQQAADGRSGQTEDSLAAFAAVLSPPQQSTARPGPAQADAPMSPPIKADPADSNDKDMLASPPKENVPPLQQSGPDRVLQPFPASEQAPAEVPVCSQAAALHAKDQLASQQHARTDADADGGADTTPEDHEEAAALNADSEDDPTAPGHQADEASAGAAEPMQSSDAGPSTSVGLAAELLQAATILPQQLEQPAATQTTAAASAQLVGPSKQPANSRSAADVLETTISKCQKVLDNTASVLLKKPASSSEAPSSHIAAAERAAMWHKELQGLVQQCKRPQLLIGVVGDTGNSLHAVRLMVCQHLLSLSIALPSATSYW